MPVEKFRSAKNIPPLPRVVGPKLAESIAEAWDWGQIRGPRSIVRGVRRFHSLADAQEAEQAEVTNHARALRNAWSKSGIK